MLALLGVAGVANANLLNDGNLQAQGEFMRFVAQHSKVYESGVELQQRYQIFLEHRNRAIEHNANPSNTWKMALNQFSDLTESEKNGYLGAVPPEKLMSEEQFDKIFNKETQAKRHRLQTGNQPFTPSPANFNWVTEGAVHAIKNQKQCGSCWAFSTCFVMESFGYITGKYKPNGVVGSLSEQYLVDCSMTRNGCDGGWPASAIGYCNTNGIPCENCYVAY